MKFVSLQEFDLLINKMQLAFEYAENLGQYVDAVKIMFQMNEQLPDDLQIILDDLDSPGLAKSFVIKYKSAIKESVLEYRQRLIN